MYLIRRHLQDSKKREHLERVYLKIYPFYLKVTMCSSLQPPACQQQAVALFSYFKLLFDSPTRTCQANTLTTERSRDKNKGTKVFSVLALVGIIRFAHNRLLAIWL
eukprot:sb/3477778/